MFSSVLFTREFQVTTLFVKCYGKVRRDTIQNGKMRQDENITQEHKHTTMLATFN